MRDSGGRVYPAKDARMSAANFQAYFPQWREFASFIDPAFSSSFWRRVTAPADGADAGVDGVDAVKGLFVTGEIA